MIYGPGLFTLNKKRILKAMGTITKMINIYAFLRVPRLNKAPILVVVCTLLCLLILHNLITNYKLHHWYSLGFILSFVY